MDEAAENELINMLATILERGHDPNALIDTMLETSPFTPDRVLILVGAAGLIVEKRQTWGTPERERQAKERAKTVLADASAIARTAWGED